MSPVIIGDATLYLGDCLDVLPTLPKVDCIVTDPPYGLGFMGKAWDHGVPSVEIWRAAFDALKPGGHLLAFSGSRTYHRMVCAIEDAGFEIRDQIMWLYGSGFPKSLDVSKAIDKAAGHWRGRSGQATRAGDSFGQEYERTEKGDPATDAARQWQGWGSALKPAHEPIVVARKPLAKGNTVAANVLQFGTGAINVDGCRVGNDLIEKGRAGRGECESVALTKGLAGTISQEWQVGRWPANLIHDGSDEVLAAFPDVHGAGAARDGSTAIVGASYAASSYQFPPSTNNRRLGDTGSAARFFYCAKASKSDRDEGLEGMAMQVVNITEGHGRGAINTSKGDGTGTRENKPRANTHPTVKPVSLMRYLCRMVTPPGGLVLDPFMGSGSTGKAARLEGFRFCGVELDPAYFEIAVRRIEQAHAQGQLFAPELEEEALL